jgi:hypothetical protein
MYRRTGALVQLALSGWCQALRFLCGATVCPHDQGTGRRTVFVKRHEPMHGRAEADSDYSVALFAHLHSNAGQCLHGGCSRTGSSSA